MLKKSTEQTSAKINSIIGSDMTVEGNIRAIWLLQERRK